MQKKNLPISVYNNRILDIFNRWTRSWAPIHMVSTYNMIVVSLDARGSAFRGNDIMHSVYQKLGTNHKCFNILWFVTVFVS